MYMRRDVDEMFTKYGCSVFIASTTTFSRPSLNILYQLYSRVFHRAFEVKEFCNTNFFLLNNV